jgi:hypothetical protein
MNRSGEAMRAGIMGTAAGAARAAAKDVTDGAATVKAVATATLKTAEKTAPRNPGGAR